MKKIVICTGGYDPLHRGHIDYLSEAAKLGHKLVVGVNSDEWLIRKKSQAFMQQKDRAAVVANLKMVDECWSLKNEDDHDDSCKKFLETMLSIYPNDEIVFANGGDRTKENIPEMEIDNPRLSFVFGVGGNKKANSSSWILNRWGKLSKFRDWGWWSVLRSYPPNVKVKELVVDPGGRLSMQRHNFRSELWFVAGGEGEVIGEHTTQQLTKYQTIKIDQNEWHQLHNTHSDLPLHIVEIQWGEQCEEEDIERK